MLLGISIALGAGKGDHWRHFLHAYLTAWSFVFSICIGSLFFVIIHHLAKAKWGIVLRRQGGRLAWVANAPDDLSAN